MLSRVPLAIAKSIFDLILDFFYFPFWWYTRGLKDVILWSFKKVLNGEKALGLRIWIMNLFHPMYGVTDWQGKIISFFMRLIQIFFRSILLLIWIFFIFLLFSAWLVTPVFIIYSILKLIILF